MPAAFTSSAVPGCAFVVQAALLTRFGEQRSLPWLRGRRRLEPQPAFKCSFMYCCITSWTLFDAGTWILNGLFSQVVTPKLQLGGELTWVVSREGKCAVS